MKRATSILLLVILTIAAWGGEPAKNFTAMEINHIRVKTPGLCAQKFQPSFGQPAR